MSSFKWISCVTESIWHLQECFYDKKSISCVHHFIWNTGHKKDKIIHHHFPNLKTAGGGFKIINTDKLLLQIQTDCCGKILKQNYSNSESLFLPIKSTGGIAAFTTDSPTTATSKNDEDEVYVAPAKNVVAGCLYASAQWKHMPGITLEILL